MAISEINQSQRNALINQQQFDWQAWQNAFNMANNFNKLSDGYYNTIDNKRKVQENFDTSAWRVAVMNTENKHKFDTAEGRTNAMNAQNQRIFDTAPYQTQADIAKANFTVNTMPSNTEAQIAKNNTIIATEPQHAQALNAQYGSNVVQSNLNRAKAQGEMGAVQWQAQNAIDPLTGRILTPEEQMTLAYQQGMAQSNPFVMQRFIQPAQTFVQAEAYNIAPYNPQYASQIRHQAGLSSTMLNADNDIIDGNSGDFVGNTDNESVPASYFATGTVGAYQDAQQKLQLEKQKQANKINQSSQVDLRNKQLMFDKAYQNALITDETTGLMRLDKEKFATEMARLSSVFGADDPYLTDFSYRVAGQQGWLEANNAPEQVAPPAGNSVPTGGIPLPKPR